MKKLLAQLDIETFVFDIKVGTSIDKLNKLVQQSETISYRVIDDHTLEADLNKSQNLNQVFEQLTAENIEVLSMRNKSNRLEALFVNLIQKATATKEANVESEQAVLEEVK
jgi:ABC-2 type transport system ATP-binding protein